MRQMDELLKNIRACHLCEGLPLGPRPILQASASSRILIAGQAPGRVTHAKGLPFDDVSGDRLRGWLGVSREQFYDANLFAIVPMGFCYPGTAKGGDLPPRPLCAEAWRAKVLDGLKKLQLTLIIGQYAQNWHMPDAPRNLTDAVETNANSTALRVLPHPSPRNGFWLKKNPWFEAEFLPRLREHVWRLME